MFSKKSFSLAVMFVLLQTVQSQAVDKILGNTVTLERSFTLKMEDCEKSWAVSISNDGSRNLEQGGCTVTLQNTGPGELVVCPNEPVVKGQSSTSSSSDSIQSGRCIDDKYKQIQFSCVKTRDYYMFAVSNYGYSFQQINNIAHPSFSQTGSRFADNKECFQQIINANKGVVKVMVLKPVPQPTPSTPTK